jgi:hypothetical protein
LDVEEFIERPTSMSSSDIRSILERLSVVESNTTPVSVKHGLNQQQKSVPQLPALFKAKDISPTLTKKPYQKHPMDGYMVGETALSGADDLRAKLKALQDIQMDPRTEQDPELKQAVIQRRADLEKEAKAKGLSEAMQEVEEDMLSKVKKDLTSYLDQLEKSIKVDGDLKNKAVNDIEDKNPAKANKQKTYHYGDTDIEEQDVDPMDDEQLGPDVDMDSEAGHAAELTGQQALDAPQAPIAPIAESPVKTYTLEDGAAFECYGNERDGFELRRGGRRMPTRFKNLDHTDMAVRLFQQRKHDQEQGQDYIEER